MVSYLLHVVEHQTSARLPIGYPDLGHKGPRALSTGCKVVGDPEWEASPVLGTQTESYTLAKSEVPISLTAGIAIVAGDLT